MNEFEAFFYYGSLILTGLIGLAALSTFFLEIPDVETWRTILLIAFVIMVFLNIIVPKPNDAPVELGE